MYSNIIETSCIEENLYYDHRIFQGVLVQDNIQSKLQSACKMVGRYAGKTVKFFRKNETKVSFLIATYSVETFLITTAITLFAYLNPIYSVLLLIFWPYYMYCQNCAIQNLAVHGD